MGHQESSRHSTKSEKKTRITQTIERNSKINIQQAIIQADKTPLTALNFQVVAVYPGKSTAKGDVMTKVMVDTPQGSPNCYVTFFTPTAPAFNKGDEVAVAAQITGQGAKGITVSEFNGNKGVNVNKEASWTVGGVAAPAAQEAQPQAVAPVVVQQAAAAVVATPAAAGTVKLTRDELLRELCKMYTEARAIAEPTLTFMDEVKGPEYAHQFALQAMSAVPQHWFGEKVLY